MNKVIIYLAAGCLLLAIQALHARDNGRPWPHHVLQSQDTLRQSTDTGRQLPELKQLVDTTPILPEDTSLRMLDYLVRADSLMRRHDSVKQGTDTSAGTGTDTIGRQKSNNTVQTAAMQSADSSRQPQSSDSTKQPSDSTKKVTDNAPQSSDSTRQPTDTSRQVADNNHPIINAGQMTDTTGRVRDSITKVPDANIKPQDSTDKTADKTGDKVDDKANDKTIDKTVDKTVPASDSLKQAQDSGQQDGYSQRGLDKRWFISPLLKGQFQDFGMLEKNRKGYLSDANTLPFQARGNGSIAASAYKNLTSRLSISADIGLSFGHVTNDNVLISQTASKTYNLLNATVYYHLLSPAYHLQPYIAIGINDLINDASYLTAPVSLGAKFNARKIMVLGQISYGCAVSKNVSNSTMYSLGIYLPIRNKKKSKQLNSDDTSPYNRPGKDDAKKKSDKDSTAAKNGGVVNNIYITINMDSVLKARGYGNDDGDGGGSGSGGRRRKKGNGGNADDDDAEARDAFKSFDLDDFASNDFKVDHIDGHPVIRFVVYFEFNEYSLTSRAFNSIDKVIGHLRNNPNMYIEIKGYTDDVGTDQYNNFLSRRRANMVKDYINSRGISADLMKAKAYGKDNPVADNGDPNKAWLNRRAEIIVRLK
jgi:outer membrane protein OmpA-like peptidoglycan-associated protein